MTPHQAGRVGFLVVALSQWLATAQVIGEGSAWPLDRSFFAAGDPFIAAYGNAPTVCKDTSGAVVPCQKINLLAAHFMNTGPLHISFALVNGMKVVAHWINQEQYLLPGYELVLHSRDTEWTAEAKDRMIADELLNESNPIKYAGSIAAFNLDGGFGYLLDRLRMPLLTGSISQLLEDADRMPHVMTPVNHAGHSFNPIVQTFQKCSWRRVGIIVDPVQFGIEAQSFRTRMESEGYTVDFYAELTTVAQLDDVIGALKRSRSRVVYVLAEAVPMVWLVCEMKLRNMARVLLMQWPGIPWFLNAGDAHDDRCKNPHVLVQHMKNQYIGWYPMTMDGSPTTEPLTCHPNKNRADAQNEILGFMGGSLAAAGVPFGAVAHMSGGAELSCIMALYLRHMIFEKNFTADEIAERTPEVYQAYLDWAWPSFHGLAGHHYYERIYNSKGEFTGQRKTLLEIILITGDDFTKSPYVGAPPPWDVGMIYPNYEVKPDGTVIDGFVNSLVFEDGATCPMDHFPDCPEGEELLMGHCVPCAAGHYLGSEGECVPCTAGMFQSEVGKTFCIGCPLGRFNNAEGQSECEQCASGFHRPSGTPSTQCLPCGTGTFSNTERHTTLEGMEKCELCPRDSYSENVASTSCTSCPAGRATAALGAADSDACSCNEGFHEEAGVCLQCPEGLHCDLGATASTAVLKEGYWSSPQNPLETYVCASEKFCPGGKPGEACGLHLEAMACAHCKAGYILIADECVQCTSFERSPFLFPILPIVLGIFIVCFLYWGSDADVMEWKSWKFGLKGVGFVLLNHYQMTALLTVPGAPKTVSSVLDVWKMSSDVLALFRPPCSGFSGFLETLIFKSSGPVIVGLIFIMTAFMSRVVARVSGRAELSMVFYRVWACYVAVIFAFFAAIAQAAFTVVKCVPNPSDKWTLHADRSVICYEDTWAGMLVIGLLAMLFWCAGFGALFARTIYVAPRFWHLKEFRLRWKPLFVKFRPQCFCFTLVVVAKGILTNVGFILFSDQLLQIYWIVFCLAVYCGMAAAYSPWRILHVNSIDVAAHLALIFLGFMMTRFTESSKSMDDAVDILAVLVSFFAAVFGFCWTLRMIAEQVTKKGINKKAAAVSNIRNAMQALVGLDSKAYQSFMDELIDYDFLSFVSACQAVPADVLSKAPEAGKQGAAPTDGVLQPSTATVWL